MDLEILTPTRAVMEVHCEYCSAEPRRECTIGGWLGRPRDPHHLRWELARRRYRIREMWFVLLEDDPRFKLEAGDILRCVEYPYDAKVSVLFREWDGYNPECNQYRHDVAFLGFVPLDMHTN